MKLKATMMMLLCVSCFPSLGLATPTIKVSPTNQSVEKGGVFQIRLEISTTEALKDVVISPLVPDGFHADPITSPPLELISLDPQEGQAKQAKHGLKLPELAAGSAITAAFRVWPPDLFGKPKKGEKEAFYDTDAPKSFVFNISYNTLKDGEPVKGATTVSTSIRYTTAIGIYLFLGMIGVVMGYLIKMGTKNREEFSKKITPETSFRQKAMGALSFVTVDNLPALLTAMTLGFAALLVLAKETIPVTGWHQSIALGISLALLTDEQLLAKTKP